jgi:SHS2 domain-containing protein
MHSALNDAGFIVLDHPADLGLEAWGSSLCEAFCQAAQGLMSIICDPDTVVVVERRMVRIEGGDFEQLLFRWLAEILYLYDGQQFVSRSFKITRLESTLLEAEVGGARCEPTTQTSRMDVKAVTYHQLRVSEAPDRCSVTVYLDI